MLCGGTRQTLGECSVTVTRQTLGECSMTATRQTLGECSVTVTRQTLGECSVTATRQTLGEWNSGTSGGTRQPKSQQQQQKSDLVSGNPVSSFQREQAFLLFIFLNLDLSDRIMPQQLIT